MVTGGPEQILARGGNDSGRFTRSIVIRMQAAGRSLAVIRAAVDDTHGRYGPPTGTPWPPALIHVGAIMLRGFALGGPGGEPRGAVPQQGATIYGIARRPYPFG
jgi:hypothetical protein